MSIKLGAVGGIVLNQNYGNLYQQTVDIQVATNTLLDDRLDALEAANVNLTRIVLLNNQQSQLENQALIDRVAKLELIIKELTGIDSREPQ